MIEMTQKTKQAEPANAEEAVGNLPSTGHATVSPAHTDEDKHGQVKTSAQKDAPGKVKASIDHHAHVGEDDNIIQNPAIEVSFTGSDPDSKGADPAILPATKTPEERFALLQQKTSDYLTKQEEDLLEKAFKYARTAHKGVKRKNGEPFISHPVEVALILADLRMDVETLCAALLHDTIEDTSVTFEDIEKNFSRPIAELVDGVTKITRISVHSLSDSQAATIRKMFVAMSKDIRVVVIKLADRLHNMRTLAPLPEDRRIFKSRETLEIYAPIAHRLGISSISWELEDLAFFWLEPTKFEQVSKLVDESRPQREAYLKKVIDILSKEMDKAGIKCQIMGRPKHLYSIYRKMTKRGKEFSEIYDLIAARIIVQTVGECYAALGAVHSLWHPIPGRFKDYIAMPKYNMYQSLHTTVIGPAGRPLEVQIRTEEMHRMSEYGIAAHWRYKEGGRSGSKKSDADFDRQLAWLRQMVDWQDETHDSREFLKSLKVDLAPSEVFVFTPKGEVMQLRAGSTPVDFAYAIHTEVGNHCVGAKVNGSIVPLSYHLQMGDRVSILTQKNAEPSRDWLPMVKTPRARSKIKSFFSKQSKRGDIQLGHERLSADMRKHGFGISNTRSVRAMKKVASDLGYKDSDDMLANIGTDRESTQHVTNLLLEELGEKKEEKAPVDEAIKSNTGIKPPMLTSVRQGKKREHSQTGIIVKGMDGMSVRLSKCCNPVPGDEIIGFVTRGRGVSVHRKSCPNAKALMQHPERIIDVAWDNEADVESVYKVEVRVEALDRMSLLRDVVNVLTDEGVNVLSSNSVSHKDNVAELRFLFQAGSVEAIQRVIKELQKVPGVFDAHRMMPGEQ